MGISIKAIAQLLDQINFAIQQMRRGQYGHWVSPYVEQTIRTAFAPTTPLMNNSETDIYVLNLNAKPVDVTINVFAINGDLWHTTVLSVLPRGTTPFRVGSDTGGDILGWIEVICSKPIYPSGVISVDRTASTDAPGVIAPMQTVGFAMQFYPVIDEG